MAVVTLAAEEARTLAGVEVSTAADPMAAFMEAAIVAALPRTAVGDRPRGRALGPSAHAVQLPDVPGLGKVAPPATHLPDGINSHPATLGLQVAKERGVPWPAPVLPPCQQDLLACRTTRR
jgi:hypothetical protein